MPLLQLGIAMGAAAIVATAGCGGSAGAGGGGGGDQGATTSTVGSGAGGGASASTGAGGTASSASTGASTDASTGPGGSSSASSGSGGGFDPASLPGLELWLVGDHATLNALGKVSTWSDETFHHHDATQLQNAALQPALVADAPGFAGHAAVRFRQCSELQIPGGLELDSREDSYVAVVASFAGSSGPAYVFVEQVAYPSLSAAFGFNLGDGEGLGLQLYRPSDEAYVAATSSLYDDTVARLYVAKVRGGQLVVTVDGSTVATAASTATEQFIEGAPFQIGASSGTNCLNADVAELFVVNNPNADTDGLEAYLMAKYGL